MDQQLTEKTFQTGTIGIHYAEGADKGPSVVLLHGGSANWHDFEDLGNVFSGHWHVYVPDLRGHGKSGRVPWGGIRCRKMNEDPLQSNVGGFEKIHHGWIERS